MEDNVDEDDVRAYIAQGLTHAQISDNLKEQFPGIKGFSARSVRRYCHEHDIHWTAPVTEAELLRKVEEGIQSVGPTYGRKAMKGLLAAQGLHGLGEGRVGRALAEVAPEYHALRQQTAARRANPMPYYAEYFGHKLHVDQNEKLVMYGVTHVAAIDGFSGKVVRTSTMPIKNNQLIYEQIFRPVTLEYGLWDQIRVDHGAEFLLSLYVQESLSQHRTDTSRRCYARTESKHNHPIERLWGEINQRINYPLKAAVNQLVEQEALDIADDCSKFSVSSVLIDVCRVGMNKFVASWNNHPIPGRGTPDFIVMQANRAAVVPAQVVPSLREAVEGYEQATGGALAAPRTFGRDVLSRDRAKEAERRIQMDLRFNPEEMFSRVVNGDVTLLQEAVMYHRQVSQLLDEN